MRLILLSVALAGLSAGPAFAQDDVARGAGGCIEELRAVLELEPAQLKTLRAIFSESRSEFETVKKGAQEKGTDAGRQARKEWQARLRERVRGTLTAGQTKRYEEWLERKDRLAREYDKALFGIPTTTEMKLRLNLPADAADRMYRASDAGIEGIRKRLLELKGQQAPDEDIARSVNEQRKALLDKLPEAAGTAVQGRVRDYIKTIGLYRMKAKNVVALSQKLMDEHGGEVPRDREALEALPGVGRKTANVVLNIAFGEETIAVDTHIFRVGNRTGLAVGKTPHDVEMKLNEVVPGKYKLHAHHWLILHGRYVCKARKPECPRCVINDLCEYRHKSVSGERQAVSGRQQEPHALD